MPMFENLTDRLQGIFDQLGAKGHLTEADVDEALKQVRLALLEADVNFKVVKEFIAKVRERAIGAEVTRSLTPAQQVVKIVNEEMINLLGEPSKLNLGGVPPSVIMLVGLQGHGKTTAAAKLALQLKRSGQRPLLVAADTRRPAAITQLEVLGRQIEVPVHSEGSAPPPPDIAAHAVDRARQSNYNVVIIDTSGRLNIDEALMKELEEIRGRTHPIETLLVVDSMTGQEAVRVAQDFHKRTDVSGLILTKMDGDARGGAALSIRHVTGVPIKYIGIGEKIEPLEQFFPDRIASRILGMGDVLSLIERAEMSMDQEEAERASKKMVEGKFDFEDFLSQLQQLKRMGPLTQILDMIPGLNQLTKQLPTGGISDKDLKRVEAIIYSMTREERRNPKILNGSRKRRIASGSGTTVQDVNNLVRQFVEMQKLMKSVGRGRRMPKGLPPELFGKEPPPGGGLRPRR